MEPMTVLLQYQRHSKGYRRYEEFVEAGSSPVVGVLYLAESRLGPKPPKWIRVVMEPAAVNELEA